MRQHQQQPLCRCAEIRPRHPTRGGLLSRIRVRLEKFQPKIREPLVELTTQPWARAKSTDEERQLCANVQVCGRRIPGIRTKSIESIPVKFSRMESTVDWIEGSKNSDTCFLRAQGYGMRFRRRGWSMHYPSTISFPILIPHEVSLSLGEPNLMYWAFLSSEKVFFTPPSNP